MVRGKNVYDYRVNKITVRGSTEYRSKNTVNSNKNIQNVDNFKIHMGHLVSKPNSRNNNNSRNLLVDNFSNNNRNNTFSSNIVRDISKFNPIVNNKDGIKHNWTYKDIYDKFNIKNLSIDNKDIYDKFNTKNLNIENRNNNKNINKN